jgi:hypothetical protein
MVCLFFGEKRWSIRIRLPTARERRTDSRRACLEMSRNRQAKLRDEISCRIRAGSPNRSFVSSGLTRRISSFSILFECKRARNEVDWIKSSCRSLSRRNSSCRLSNWIATCEMRVCVTFFREPVLLNFKCFANEACGRSGAPLIPFRDRMIERTANYSRKRTRVIVMKDDKS